MKKTKKLMKKMILKTNLKIDFKKNIFMKL